MRSTMADLVARVRQLIHDTPGATQVYTDDEIESLLDANRTDVRYMPLTAVDTIAPGGQISHLEYRARVGNWEDSPTLLNGQYGTVVPTVSDNARGVWAFSAHQAAPVYIVGSRYNVYAAAADALDMMAAREQGAIDFTADGLTVKRSQRVTQLQSLAMHYRSMAGPVYAQMMRGDVNA